MKRSRNNTNGIHCYRSAIFFLFTVTFLILNPVQSFHLTHWAAVDFSHGSADPSLFLKSDEKNDVNTTNEGIRLNKCFKATHSRRKADSLIESGRVEVNGVVGTAGQRVVPGKDVVTLDGQVINWEELNIIRQDAPEQDTRQLNDRTSRGDKKSKRKSGQFSYVKYWKPKGVICTTDESIRNNIIDSLRSSPQATASTDTSSSGFNPKNRVFPVGRLDKDSTGLIILTSDGRLPNAINRFGMKQPKVYLVRVDLKLRSKDIRKLRDGVVITTVAQRDGKSKPLTAKTLPCDVTQISDYELEIVLMEGRNRQIRKMLGALGYTVLNLHRVKVMDITLDGLKSGTWNYLSEHEMVGVRDALKVYDSNKQQHY